MNLANVSAIFQGALWVCCLLRCQVQPYRVCRCYQLTGLDNYHESTIIVSQDFNYSITHRSKTTMCSDQLCNVYDSSASMHQRQSSHCNGTWLVEGLESAGLWIGIEPIEFLDGFWWKKTALSRLYFKFGLLSNFRWLWNAIEGHYIYYYTRHSQNPKWIIIIPILKEHLTNQFIEHSGDQASFNAVVIMLVT